MLEHAESSPRNAKSNPARPWRCWFSAAGNLKAKRLFAPSLRGRGREVALELAAAVKPALGPNNLLCVFADTYNMEPEPFLAALQARSCPA